MIWVLTALLCLGLLGAVVGVLNPRLITEFLVKRWQRKSYYHWH